MKREDEGMRNMGGRLVNTRGCVRHGADNRVRKQRGKVQVIAEREKKKAGVECCFVCLVPFKGLLNYFTMLCLQRLQDSWSALPISSNQLLA